MKADKTNDSERAKHILDAIIDIENFLEGVTFDKYETNKLLRFAVERALTIIGEASVHITEETKNEFNSVHWKGIKGFRNIIIHEYFGTDSDVIWNLIHRELSPLRYTVQQIIEANQKQS